MGTPTLHLDLEKILNQPTYPEVLVKKKQTSTTFIVDFY